MRAILMAAGVGSRVSRSVQKPKSTLDVGNISIIRHTVEMLLNHGVKVAVVVGYKREDIYAELDGLEVTYYWNPYYKVTNSMASLWFAQDFIKEDEDLLLANADVYWDDELYELILNDTRLSVMLSDKSRVLTGDYFFKVEDEKIVKYGKELDVGDRSCEYVGIAKLSQNILKKFVARLNYLVEKDMYNLWWENVLYEYADIDSVYVRDVDGRFWAEVDYIEDYYRILSHLNLKKGEN